MSHDVFISYSSKDRQKAEIVRTELEASGISCWFDRRDIVTGPEWSGTLIKAIHDCRALVLILSVNSNESKNVLREVAQAFENDLPIVTLQLEEMKLGDSLAYYLGLLQRLEAFALPFESYLPRLVADLKSQLDQVLEPNYGVTVLSGRFDEILREAQRRLSVGEYALALAHLDKVGPDATPAQLSRGKVLRVVAIAGGRGFNALSPKEIEKVEDSLILAKKNLDESILPVILLATLEIEYFRYHGTHGKSGISATTTKALLNERGLSADEVEVLRLVNLGEVSLRFLGLTAR